MTPNIHPSSDLRNHDAEASRECREARRPTVITVNGRGDTVLLGYEEYSRMQSELELLSALADSERDVAEGRVSSPSTSFDNLRKQLAAREEVAA